MNYIKYTFENGNVINIPEEFIVLDNHPEDPRHYRVELILYQYFYLVFKVTHIDGKILENYSQDSSWITYFSPDKLANKKILPCSIEKFNKMKAFL